MAPVACGRRAADCRARAELADARGVAVETAGSWLDASEEAHLIFSCPFFAWSERERAARNRKFYPIDPGPREVVATPGAPDCGKALEIATFVALRRAYREVGYRRGDGEVDVIVLRDGRPVPVQVTAGSPQPRHDRALRSFYVEHPTAEEAVFITLETFEEEVGRLIEGAPAPAR